MKKAEGRLVIQQPGVSDCMLLPPHTAPRNEIERIYLLNHLAQDLKSSRRLEEKLRRTVDNARILANADVAFVCSADRDGESHLVNAVSGDIAVDGWRFRLPINIWQAGPSRAEDRTTCDLVRMSAQFLEATEFADQVQAVDIRYGLAVPFQVEGRHLGFLFAGNRKPVEFTRTETCLLSLIGNLLSAEIHRKQSEENQIRLETVLEQAVESIMITDREGVIQYVNPEFEAVSGYRRGEVIGRSPEFLRSGYHPAGFYEEIRQTLRNGEIWRGHFVNKRKDGTAYEWAATISPVRNDEGEITHYVSVRKDITQESSLRKQLYQAQKMEAIGTLAGGIAHDFNNLLMGIQGNVSVMRMELPPVHPDQKRCRVIEDYVKKGADLTRQLLGIARDGKYEQVPTDITRLVNATLKMFGRTKKEIQIHPAAWDRPCVAEVDPGQIDQVLLNLFVNAWHAMPDGGHLYAQTQIVSVGGAHQAVADLKPGSYVKIAITDTGTGMSKPVLDRIFDPFFTTKGKNRGTGLGLASAYGIVKNHEGMIQVRSEAGNGATFEIFLPESRKESLKMNTPKDTLATGRGTILLVDDEDMVVDICCEMLKRLGYTVFTAAKGDAAVSIFETRKEEIDLVILDLIMPEMSGREVFQKLSSLKPGVKVLLASGYSLDRQARELLSAGAAGFIQKPYAVNDLSQKVRQALSS